MIFADLYNYAESLPKPPVGFEFLRKTVVAHHPTIGRVDVYAVEYPAPNNQAHFRHGDRDRTSPYDDDFEVAEIIYCHALEADIRERRYALTKELMHIFDGPEARVDTKEKFSTLLREIQNRPLPEDASAMFLSELDTRWMAALILCPKRFRDQYLDAYRNKELAIYDIAEIFEIPEWVVPFVMDDYYDRAYQKLITAPKS
ncbi:hypothetical protein [Bradyrhizobium sp. SZCCHNG3015]|uniref:hypothetical protein n=1 Tax=Bradyrhizobium sp. SZCCHNG3015 TaxID=3057270 RepID=UPI0028E2D6EE|nr:hypothetical protein [Bradyrhizobium sp. SZCCHNG3015]